MACKCDNCICWKPWNTSNQHLTMPEALSTTEHMVEMGGGRVTLLWECRKHAQPHESYHRTWVFPVTSHRSKSSHHLDEVLLCRNTVHVVTFLVELDPVFWRCAWMSIPNSHGPREHRLRWNHHSGWEWWNQIVILQSSLPQSFRNTFLPKKRAGPVPEAPTWVGFGEGKNRGKPSPPQNLLRGCFKPATW
jgi:hypothetical protein